MSVTFAESEKEEDSQEEACRLRCGCQPSFRDLECRRPPCPIRRNQSRKRRHSHRRIEGTRTNPEVR